MIISRLDALEERLEKAARRRDAQGLAMAAQDLDDALRRMGRRLEQLLGCMGSQPGLGRQDWGLGEISRKSLELLMYKHSFSLWRRWEEPLRSAYLELGRQSFSKGRFETARVLLGQALASMPTLPLNANETLLLGHVPRLRPRRRHSLAAWFSRDSEISGIARHPASGGYFILDHVSGQILRLSPSLEPLEICGVRSELSWTMFPDPTSPGGGIVWICAFREERLIGLDDHGRETASIPLSQVLGATFSTVRPIFGTSAEGWLYLVVAVPSNPTLLIRFRSEDPAATIQAFGHPWFKAAFGVHARNDLLLTMHWQPPSLMVLKHTGNGSWCLVCRILLPRPHTHPLSCYLLEKQVVVTTNNSLLRLGADLHPVYRHDQLTTVSSVLDQAFERFCPDGFDGLLVLDRFKRNIWQVTP